MPAPASCARRQGRRRNASPCSMLDGLWLVSVGRAQLETARTLGEQLLHLAQRMPDATLLLEAHRALGPSLFSLRALAPARAHRERAIWLYEPQHHRSLAFRSGQDPGVVCRGVVAWASGLLGYPDQALKGSADLRALAQELAPPCTLAYALDVTARMHQLRGEGKRTQQWAAALRTLSRQQGVTHRLATGMILWGWALTAQGHRAAGMAQGHQGLDAFRATRAERARPYDLAWLAEAYKAVGEVEEGLRLLAEALGAADHSGERFSESELYRLKGEFLLGRSAAPHTEAETCLRQALDVARRQQAKALELRAAMSLSRLWPQQGKRAEAHQRLAPIYSWFTEGFDTADLQEAKGLLDELS
jgi:predicted ATPase